MNSKENVKKQIEVMLHYVNGGEIEYKYRSNVYGGWGVDQNPVWDWFNCDYRKVLPKKTIYRYLYRNKRNGRWIKTSAYFENDKDFINSLKEDADRFEKIMETALIIEDNKNYE